MPSSKFTTLSTPAALEFAGTEGATPETASPVLRTPQKASAQGQSSVIAPARPRRIPQAARSDSSHLISSHKKFFLQILSGDLLPFFSTSL